MDIVIPINEKKLMARDKQLYFGDKKRYSSMTSVVFVSPNRFVCASYVMCEMYLVEFDMVKNEYKILFTLSTTGDPQRRTVVNTDLIDYNSELQMLVVSNYRHKSMTFYKYHDRDARIVYYKTVQNLQQGSCHGICWIDNDMVGFGTCGRGNDQSGVYLYDLLQNGIIASYQELQNNYLHEPSNLWLCKDIAINPIENLSTNQTVKTIYAIYCEGAPHPTDRLTYDSKVVMYHLVSTQSMCKIIKIKEQILPRCHCDCVRYVMPNSLYITVQLSQNEQQNDNATNELGKVLVLDGETLELKKEYNDYEFPHGVDVRYGMMAVTEYSKSNIKIVRI